MPYREKHPCVYILASRRNGMLYAAIRREKQLKEWRRAWKIRLVESMNPEWIDLFEEASGEILDGPADVSRCSR